MWWTSAGFGFGCGVAFTICKLNLWGNQFWKGRMNWGRGSVRKSSKLSQNNRQPHPPPPLPSPASSPTNDQPLKCERSNYCSFKANILIILKQLTVMNKGGQKSALSGFSISTCGLKQTYRVCTWSSHYPCPYIPWDQPCCNLEAI